MRRLCAGPALALLAAVEPLASQDSPVERARLQTAIMLHTDRDAFERTQAPVVETSRDCGVTLQAAFAESLVGLLLVKGQEVDFVRRWYLAMTLGSH